MFDTSCGLMECVDSVSISFVLFPFSVNKGEALLMIAHVQTNVTETQQLDTNQ